MKRLSFIIILIFISYSSCSTKTNLEEEINEFNNFLGKEKAIALDRAVESFHHFLDLNYPESKTLGEKTYKFLKSISKDSLFKASWKFENNENLKVLTEIEESGLRKELYLFSNETYNKVFDISEIFKYSFEYKENDTIPEIKMEISDSLIKPLTRKDSIHIAVYEKKIKERSENSLYFNREGLFLYGLAKFAIKDSVVKEYVETNVIGYDIFPSMLASVLAEKVSPIELENPFIQRIIVADLYFFILRINMNR